MNFPLLSKTYPRAHIKGGVVAWRGCPLVVLHRWFKKFYKQPNSLNIGVSTDVQTCSSPSCVFSRWKHLKISSLFLPFLIVFGVSSFLLQDIILMIFCLNCTSGLLGGFIAVLFMEKNKEERLWKT